MKRESFKVTKITRKFDRCTGKFTINIRYKTKTEVTPRTVAVSEAFGLGVDAEKEHVVYDNVELKIGPKDVVYITGDSGSGKSFVAEACQNAESIKFPSANQGLLAVEEPSVFRLVSS